MNFREHLVATLKQLRKQENLTQREVAKQIGIEHQSYQAYESGVALPTIENLIKIADVYDVSVDFLLGRAKI